MEIFDNITKVVRDDLKEKIRPHSHVAIAAACFSMYAYKELKSQLEKIDSFSFIFTSPTFIQEKAEKQKTIRNKNAERAKQLGITYKVKN